ncbi:signal peptidase I [Gordonia rubripertincta]|uniref:signal peptidase I n=1 Tax=Gordonia rubripertincta TaxID=36822 RepID=UPI000B8D9DE7|nr:signal peptidase I [Gordonia rubripertincta]ASR04176.1 Signal peptidase I W [Gordonia rubripertincta]
MNEPRSTPALDDQPMAEFDNPDAGRDQHPDVRRGVLHHLWQAVSWLLLIGALAILCATILIPKIAGAAPYTVLTGSMKPDYPPGTLIVVKPRPAGQIGVGDVITYQIRSGSPEVVTHRVIEVMRTPAGEQRFVTQGDANNVADAEPVRPVQVRGTLWYSVPYIGWVNNWFTEKRRTVTAFALAGLLFVYGAWQFIADRRERENDDPEPAP